MKDPTERYKEGLRGEIDRLIELGRFYDEFGQVRIILHFMLDRIQALENPVPETQNSQKS